MASPQNQLSPACTQKKAKHDIKKGKHRCALFDYKSQQTEGAGVFGC